MTGINEHEGRKYLRKVVSAVNGDSVEVDVYAVLVAFGVTCPATQHAIKKLLCAGGRGKGDRVSDLTGALAAVNRAVELAKLGTEDERSPLATMEKINESIRAIAGAPSKRKSQSGTHFVRENGEPLCAYKPRLDEGDITLTGFADAVTCHTCLSIMGRITKEAMGFGKPLVVSDPDPRDVNKRCDYHHFTDGDTHQCDLANGHLGSHEFIINDRRLLLDPIDEKLK